MLRGAAAISFGLVAAASFLPGARLWGINHLAFVPLPARAAALAAIAVLFLPGVARAIHRIMVTLVGRLERLSPVRAAGVLLIVSLFATGAFFAFRSATNLLGDGQFIVQTFEAAREGQQASIVRSIPAILENEYVAQGTTILYYGAGKAATDVLGEESPVAGIRAFVSILGGLLVFLFLLFVRRVDIGPELKVWLVVLALFSAPIVFYFGYIENYGPLVFFLMLYVVGAFAVMSSGGAVWPSLLAFLAACYCHIQGIVFLPSIVFLLAWKHAGSRRPSVVRWLPGVLIALALAGAVVVRFTRLGRFALPVLPVGNGSEYAVLHPLHVADIANELLMLLPILPVVGALWWIGRSLECALRPGDREPSEETRFARKVEWRFVELMVAGNLVYLVAFRPEIGMARDWDLFAMATVAIVPYTLLVLGRYLRLSGAPSASVATWSTPTLALAVAVAISWIAINASTWRSADRFEAILDYDKTHGSYASENLATVYHENGRLDRAVDIMEMTFATWRNPRHAVRLALLYEDQGRSDAAVDLLSSVLDVHPDHHAVRFKLLSLLESQNRWDEMGTAARAGIQHYPRDAVFHFYYGQSLLRSGDTTAAVETFRRCLELDPPAQARAHIQSVMDRLGVD